MNPIAILLILACVVVGALFFGSWLWGLLVGVLIVLAATLLPLLRA